MDCRADTFSKHKQYIRTKRILVGSVLCVLLMITAFWRISQGEWEIPPERVVHLLSPFLPETEKSMPDALVVRAVRIPRFAAAVGTGALLATAGTVLQGLLSNPLAEPYTLGIAAGAAFGGVLGFFFSSMMITPMAFLGALLALWFVNAIAWKGGGGSSAHMVLAGIVTNAVLSAGVTFLKAIADDRLGAIVLWLMGSMSGASVFSAYMVWIAAAVVFIPSLIYGRQLDAVSLGEGHGELLGIDEKRLRLVLLCAASMATAVAVSFFGIIGFVGLVTPHLIRIIAGPSHRQLLVYSFIGGGLLLAVADGAAQFFGELPVGVVTAMVGGPFFCMILMTGKKTAS